MQEKKKKITERWWVEMGKMLKAIKGLLDVSDALMNWKLVWEVDRTLWTLQCIQD